MMALKSLDDGKYQHYTCAVKMLFLFLLSDTIWFSDLFAV